MDINFKNAATLIKHLVQGDERAYAYLIDEFYNKLYVYTYSLTNDDAMSKDIIQNVFLKTWEFRSKLNEKYSIQNFLYKSVYNEFINQYHKNRSISVLEQAYIEALDETIQESNEELLKKRIAFINKEIDNLPKKCKKTFLLSKKEGLSNIEIAEYLNISIKSVEAHITKAYSIIRKKAKEKMYNILFLLLGNTVKKNNR
ncbi:sigma-70 family RNA polymerase sigma factor [uncultured Wocania sp.]|uniref:RNA polymerase sigma factor n=1 Tax=uncultured Wocania sp. TaxID=2834404 RepID=UPI0030F576C4